MTPSPFILTIRNPKSIIYLAFAICLLKAFEFPNCSAIDLQEMIAL